MLFGAKVDSFTYLLNLVFLIFELHYFLLQGMAILFPVGLFIIIIIIVYYATQAAHSYTHKTIKPLKNIKKTNY